MPLMEMNDTKEGGDKCERDITKFPEHLRIRQVP